MPITRDVLVIGGSAGAVKGLVRLVPQLPAGLAARVFVTIHIAPTASALPAILTRAGHLVARHPSNGESTEPGIIYVAPPDHHLLVRRGRVRVVSGPREHGHRPAVDPLFRSAAECYGTRVVCVVLSGNLDDGCAGALAVHHAGGAVIVQDPAECEYPGMPAATLAEIPSAIVLPLERIAPRILRELGAAVAVAAGPARDVDPGAQWRPIAGQPARDGVPSGLTCPECRGAMYAVPVAGALHYRCSVGHAFTSDALFVRQRASLAGALRTTLRALEESAETSRRLHERAAARGNARATESYARSVVTGERRARAIRALLRARLPWVLEAALPAGALPARE